MSPEKEAVVQVQKLSFAYEKEGSFVLKGISFDAYPGEIVGVMGPSGCGKSTLCLCLGGIIPHHQGGRMEGEVWLEGERTRDLSLPRIATRVGLVFQDPEAQLFLPRVQNELAFGPENLCYSREDIRQRVEDTARRLSLQHLLLRNPNELSGGQQQLVAVAAVLALDPGVLILDEAASQLDREGQERLLEIVCLLRQEGKTVIMVDHNLERLKLADRLLALNRGRLVAQGCPEEIMEDAAALERCYSFSA